MGKQNRKGVDMKKHTPGPWMYWESVGQINARDNPIQICDIRPHGDQRSADENRANANLIAAAPDLLEALDEVIGLWNPCEWPALPGQTCYEVGIACHDSCPCRVAYDKARAAIAKAKGESL
jgi:hypothetical protein